MMLRKYFNLFPGRRNQKTHRIWRSLRGLHDEKKAIALIKETFPLGEARLEDVLSSLKACRLSYGLTNLEQTPYLAIVFGDPLTRRKITPSPSSLEYYAKQIERLSKLTGANPFQPALVELLKFKVPAHRPWGQHPFLDVLYRGPNTYFNEYTFYDGVLIEQSIQWVDHLWYYHL